MRWKNKNHLMKDEKNINNSLGVVTYLAEDRSHGYVIPYHDYITRKPVRGNGYLFHPRDESIERNGIINAKFLGEGEKKYAKYPKGELSGLILPFSQGNQYLLINPKKNISLKLIWKGSDEERITEPIVGHIHVVSEVGIFIFSKYKNSFQSEGQIKNKLLRSFRNFIFRNEVDFRFLGLLIKHLDLSLLLSDFSRINESLNRYNESHKSRIRNLLTNYHPELKTTHLDKLGELFDVEDLIDVQSVLDDLKKSLYASLPIQIIDIEARGSAQTIQEYASIFKGISKVLKFGSYSGKPTMLEKEILEGVESQNIIVGHNIIAYDLPLLENKIEFDFAKNEKYDTLLWEVLLSPSRNSYALQTHHTALEDAKLTEELFFIQICKLIVTEQYNSFSHLLPDTIKDFIDEKRQERKSLFTLIIQTLEQSSQTIFKVKQENRFTKMLEEAFDTFYQEGGKAQILICSPSHWDKVLKMKNSNFSFQTYEPMHQFIDVEKIGKSINPSSFAFSLLGQIIHHHVSHHTTPYWINIPPFIQQYLLYKERLQLSDICSIPSSPKLENNIWCLSPVEFLSRERLVGEEVIYVDDGGLEKTSKTLLVKLSHNELNELWEGDYLWKSFSNRRTLVEVDEENGQKLKKQFDGENTFQHYWIEHVGNQQYYFWASLGAEKLSSLFENENFKKIEVEKLIELENKGNAYAIDFRLNINVNPDSRILSLNPETGYRDVYWTTLLYKIDQYLNSHPAILFVLDPNEIEQVADFFRAAKYYVPTKEASTSRQLELVVSSFQSKKIAIFSFSNFDEVAKWLPKQYISILIEGLPLDENIVYQKMDFVEDRQEEMMDNEADVSERNINLESDVFKKFELFHSQFKMMEYLIWQYGVKHDLILLDPRLNDFPAIQKKYGIRVHKVPEFETLELYNELLSLARNFINDTQYHGEINVEEVTPVLEKVFIDGHNFRPDQKAFLERILPAKENMVVTLPTGGGKSVLFEGPALYRGAIYGRLTLIISPLKALMEDHFNKLTEKGFFTSIEYINQDKGLEIQDIYRRIAGGEILFIYITPERFKSQGFIAALNQRLRTDKQLEYAVFDEAHCISQWGNEFRPDYHRAANEIRAIQESSGFDFPVLLFSATVTEQVYHHLTKYFDNLQRIEEYTNYNPIRDHIQIGFQQLEKEFFVDELIWNLKQDFRPEQSRVIVFVSSRKKTEEYSNKFNDEPGHAFKSDYYHAGLDSEYRQTAYDQYKKGEISVLFATKAFGMGMDIPNIHFVYHFGPSSNFEDFLQEIGRAGRNKKSRLDAGFDEGNPIITKCFFTKKDFEKIRDLSQKRQMSWTEVKEVGKELRLFFEKCQVTKPDKENPVPVPLDLLNTSAYFADNEGRDSIFRLSSYWLEKTGKFKQRYYVPGLLEFSNQYEKEDNVNGKEEKEFIQLLNKKKTDASTVHIPITEVYEIIGKKSLSRVFQMIINLHNTRAVKFIREIRISPFKTLNVKELQIYAEHQNRDIVFPLFAVISLLRKLVFDIPKFDRRIYNKEDILLRGEEVFEEHFNVEAFKDIWKDENSEKEAKNRLRFRKKKKADFLKKRMPFVFYLINQIPKLKAEYKIELESKEVFTVIYRNTSTQEINTFLTNLEADATLLINLASQKIRSAENKTDLMDFINALNLRESTLNRLNLLFTTWKKIGFFKLDNALLPIAIEMFLLDKNSVDEINKEDDKSAFEEFNNTISLKRLRLLVLESLQRIPAEKHDNYIKDYFNCESGIDIVNLIGEYDKKANLQSYREEALVNAIEELNPDQKAIFDFPLGQNLNVIAGPGTGKTHTLIIRVARLIQREFINPSQILVLAYNRSVVQELRSRIKSLFDQLGYSTITYDLRVNTFHGFIKSVLGDKIKDAEAMFPDDGFKSWEKYFLHLHKTAPGFINNAVGGLQYIFVDEFQDITTNRVEILKAITREGITKLTVIGDPIQSIYGFDRIQEGGPIEPKSYYDEFNEAFQSKVLPLGINYRSYQEIVDYAQNLLPQQITDYDMPVLTANKGSQTASVIRYDLTEENNNWEDKVSEFLEDKNSIELAILFRANAELFRTFAKLRSMPLGSAQIYIQSSNDNFSRTREISYFLDWWNKYPTNQITSSNLDKLIERVKEVYKKHPAWDKLGIRKLISLVKEFQQNLRGEEVILDLVNYIQDVSRRDDGVLWKIYSKHYDMTGVKRLILSTMHKAKGLEFENVMILPSFLNLKNNGNGNFDDACKEEERLLFVATTRARDNLYHYLWQREHRVFNREEFTYDRAIGCPMEPDMSNLFSSSFGVRNSQEFIINHLIVGQEVIFKKEWDNRVAYINNQKLGKLRKSITTNMNNRFGDKDVGSYFVTGTFKYSNQEIEDYDEKHGTRFFQMLDDFTKKQGYVLLPLFAGFGETIG